MMSDKFKFFKSVSVIVVATVISKVAGFIREAVLASKFGASVETDAYIMAITIPMTLFATAGMALTTTFIPLFNDKLHNKGKDDAFDFANNIINIFAVILIGLSLIGIIAAPLIVRIVAFGFKGEAYQLSVTMVRITFPMILFIGLSAILSGILNAMGIYSPPAFKGIPYNIILIAFMLFFSSLFGIYGLAVSTLIATLSEIFVQIPALKKAGFVYRFRLDFMDKALQRQIILVGPILVGTAADQLNVLVDRTLGSTLPKGSISALNYANRLDGFIIGIFINAITTVVYTDLTKLSAKNDRQAYASSLTNVSKLMIFFAMPIAVGGAVLADLIVKAAYQRGAFTAQDTALTSAAFLFYVLGMVGYSLRHMLSRAFYAMKDTRTPVKNGIIAIVINIVLNLVFIGPMKAPGLALATAISATVTAVLLLIQFHRRLEGFDLKEIAVFAGKAAVGSLVMGGVVWGLKKALIPLGGLSTLATLAAVLGLVVVGILVYVVVSYFLRVEELSQVAGLIKKKIRG